MIEQSNSNGAAVATGASHADVVAMIARIIGDVCESKGLPRRPVGERTDMLSGDLGIDSLDLASVVLQVEGETGRDPFAEGFVNFKTVGDLARLFAK